MVPGSSHTPVLAVRSGQLMIYLQSPKPGRTGPRIPTPLPAKALGQPSGCVKGSITALKDLLYFSKNAGVYPSVARQGWGATFFSCNSFKTLLLLCFFSPRLQVWYPSKKPNECAFRQERRASDPQPLALNNSNRPF